MKKLLFFFLILSGYLFSQTYQAKATIDSVWWQNEHEWGAA